MIISLIFGVFINLLTYSHYTSDKSYYEEAAISKDMVIQYCADIIYKYPPGEGSGILKIDINTFTFISGTEKIVKQYDEIFASRSNSVYSYLGRKYINVIKEQIELFAANHHFRQIYPITGKIYLHSQDINHDIVIRKKELFKLLTRSLKGVRREISNVLNLMSVNYYNSDTLTVLLSKSVLDKSSEYKNQHFEFTILDMSSKMTDTWSYPTIGNNYKKYPDHDTYKTETIISLKGAENDSPDCIIPIKEKYLVIIRNNNDYLIESNKEYYRSLLDSL